MSEAVHRRRNGCVMGRAVAALVVFVALGACAAAPPALDLSRIGEARLEGIEAEPIVLDDGAWEGEPVFEGGPVRPRVGLIEEFALEGSFTGSGRTEAAVLVWHSGGGSGTRIFIAVLEGGEDRPHSVATTLVGDRVQVIDFRAEERAIVLDLIAHGPDDAACCPGQHELRRYRFEGSGASVEFEDLGRATTGLLAGRTWRLEQFDREQPVTPGVEITIRFDGHGGASGSAGCNLYEATVEESPDKNLTVAARPTTARRCPADQVGAESEYLRRLDAVTRFSFMNGRLVLQYGSGEDFGAMSLAPAEQSTSP